jgi:glyoxylase-like metal-dependent hydrolase (beta-lactamase superfamily II)
MEVTRIEKGLWRWTAAHPEWTPGADWEREVGCVYWEAPDAVVLVDPLVPADGASRDRFLDALDRDVERVDQPVVVLLTCAWHARSSDELAGRYDGRVLAAADALPGGVVAFAAPTADEVVFWLPAPRSLVPGDVILGTDAGLRLCPESWLGSRGGIARLVDDLAALLELPAERVLTSHGPPVLSGGRDALSRALAAGRGGQPPA